MGTAVGAAVGAAVGTAVGTAGHSTGVLPDTVRMFRIQYGCFGYIADVPDTVRICRMPVNSTKQNSGK